MRTRSHQNSWKSFNEIILILWIFNIFLSDFNIYLFKLIIIIMCNEIKY